MTKPKITIGTVEIGGSVAIYAREFRKLGYDVQTVVMFKNWAFPDEEYDSVCLDASRHAFQESLRHDNPLAKFSMFGKIGLFGLKEFIKSLGKNNWFIFIFGSNFLPFHYSFPFLNFTDYAILKKLGNVIVSIFVGCDIRDKSTISAYASKYNIYYACEQCRKKPTKCDPKRARRVARGAEKYSDIILTVPDLAFFLNRPYYFFWLPLELDTYEFRVPANQMPKIIHAPTSQVMKGSNIIMQGLEQLEREGIQFEKILLEKMSNQDVKEVLSAGDIVIDQTYSNGTGKLALEGMASGCVVLCGLNKEFMGMPEECPAIPIEPDSGDICQKLKSLLAKPEKIYARAEQGRNYVEKYHDSSKIVKQIIHWIEDRPEDELIYPKH